MIEEIVGLAENLEPVALISAGETSIALAVLHHDRVKRRCGDNRRFICCNRSTASRAHFLTQICKVTGAGVENPEDFTSLQPFLSSRETTLFFDNAESILDPQGTDASEICGIVGGCFSNISLGINSRISTVLPHFNRPIILALTMESACNTLYGIYKNGGPSDVVNNFVRQLDFHALSITLIATTAAHNVWDYDRLVEEWDEHRAQVLPTDYNESLAGGAEKYMSYW